jgi:hypothetical protein
LINLGKYFPRQSQTHYCGFGSLVQSGFGQSFNSSDKGIGMLLEIIRQIFTPLEVETENLFFAKVFHKKACRNYDPMQRPTYPGWMLGPECQPPRVGGCLRQISNPVGFSLRGSTLIFVGCIRDFIIS